MRFRRSRDLSLTAIGIERHKTSADGIDTFLTLVRQEDPRLQFRVMPKQSCIHVVYRLFDQPNLEENGHEARWAGLTVKTTRDSTLPRFYINASKWSIHHEDAFVGVVVSDGDGTGGEGIRFCIRRLGRESQSDARNSGRPNKRHSIVATDENLVHVADVVGALVEWWNDLPRRTWDEWLDAAWNVPSFQRAVSRVRYAQRMFYDPLGLVVSDFMLPRMESAFNSIVDGRRVIHRSGSVRKCDAVGAFLIDMRRTYNGDTRPLSTEDEFDYIVLTLPSANNPAVPCGLFVASRDDLVRHGVLWDTTDAGNRARLRSFRIISPKVRPLTARTKQQQAWQSEHYIDIENWDAHRCLRKFAELFGVPTAGLVDDCTVPTGAGLGKCHEKLAMPRS